MSHWFHRNAIKATAPVDFNLKAVLTNEATSKIVSQLRSSRAKLLELMSDSGNELHVLEAEFTKYAALLQGFLEAQDGKGGKSKLRQLLRFRWTQSVQNGSIPLEVNDAAFESLNMCLNMGFWYTKHAARIAGNDEVTEEQALQVHRCLRKAAGLFAFVMEQKDSVSQDAEKGTDLSDLVLEAYSSQTLGEAQEVVVARALEKGNAADLVSALAAAAARLFRKADDALAPLDAALFEKWRVYLQLKRDFYLATAFAFRGAALLGEDKCGEAVRACREGQRLLSAAEAHAEVYKKARGPKSTKAAKCESHLFFRRLAPILTRQLEKAERENGFIYHQAVPDELPALSDDAKFGLVSAVDFVPPPPDAQWAPHVYQAFDLAKANMPDFNKVKKGEKELGDVKEVPIYQTAKDPSNNSGCTIS